MPTDPTETRNSAADILHRQIVCKRIFAILAILGSLLALACLGGIIFLAVPGRPPAFDSLRFDGFIELPRHGSFSILDYFSLEQGHLYVTNITHGTLFDITLKSASDASLTRVDEMAGPAAAHGVALVPSQGIGYITRSIVNRVDLFDAATFKPLGHISVPEDRTRPCMTPELALCTWPTEILS